MPIFFHLGIMHIAGAVIGNLIMGLACETIMGIKKFLIMYYVSGIGANLLSCFFHPYQLAVGSSGAFFSVYAYLMFHMILSKNFKEKYSNCFRWCFVVQFFSDCIQAPLASM